MIDDIPPSLLDGSDCPLHYHSSDRTPRQDFLHGLQLVTRIREIAVDYTLDDNDDIVVVTAGGDMTLPLSRGGREYEVVAGDSTAFYVYFTGTDTLYGNTDVYVAVQGTALHFKAISGGWILI